jgi:hypothetical protein
MLRGTIGPWTAFAAIAMGLSYVPYLLRVF